MGADERALYIAVVVTWWLQGSLVKTLRDVRPTAFLGVPRVWEKIQESMVAVGRTQWWYKRWIAQWAKYIGLHGNLSLMNGYVV